MLPHKVRAKVKCKKAKSKIVGVIFLLFTSYFLPSCSSQPTDLRTLIPADSLVYLESNDLGAVMKAITDRPAFREAAKTIPDFSVLNGVRLAVAVTGFETKEQPVTDEASVLNFQPRFVAILETNAWNFQALSFTENQLGEFINKVYGGEVLLETSDKHDGKYLVWKANDGRKAFALVQGSLIFFGNDETAVEKSLAVKRGEADNISRNPKITNGDRLAFGYISTDGVAQLANVLGVKYASDASDEPEVQSAVAGILPRLLRNSVTDVTWTANTAKEGIEDKWQIGVPNEISSALHETMVSAGRQDGNILGSFPEDFRSMTAYNFRDPRLAWRSLYLAALRNFDPQTQAVASVFLNSLLEPYGIGNPELYLSAAGPLFITAQFDDSVNLKVAVTTTAKDEKKVAGSLSAELKPFRGVLFEGGQMWETDDRETRAFVNYGRVVSGERESVTKLEPTDPNDLNSAKNEILDRFRQGDSPVTTVSKDYATASILVGMLSARKDGAIIPPGLSYAYTNFPKSGIERRTVSDFGLIGWIITQFGKE